MSLPLADKIKPKNNGTFALVDAADVEMPNGTRLSDLNIGSLNVVNFDFASMGLPNLMLNGDPLRIEMDTTELGKISATGIIVLSLNIEYNGLVFNNVKATYLPYSSVATIDLIGNKCFVSLNWNANQVLIYAVRNDWDNLFNKPFYEEGGEAEIFAEQTITTAFFEAFNCYVSAISPHPFSLTVGEKYKVVWDGQPYEVEAIDCSAVTGNVAVGNGTAFDLSGNNEPFAIVYTSDSDVTFVALTDTAPTEHTVSVYHDTTVIKTLDEKFLPMEAIDARIEAKLAEIPDVSEVGM